jgi:hypothetical protein
MWEEAFKVIIGTPVHPRITTGKILKLITRLKGTTGHSPWGIDNGERLRKCS